MRVILNQPLQIAGFRNPLPQGAIVTVVDEAEANQLKVRGYFSETTKAATHDHLSIKAEKEAAEKAAAEQAEHNAAVAEADAEAESEIPDATTSPKASGAKGGGKNNRG